MTESDQPNCTIIPLDPSVVNRSVNYSQEVKVGQIINVSDKAVSIQQRMRTPKAIYLADVNLYFDCQGVSGPHGRLATTKRF